MRTGRLNRTAINAYTPHRCARKRSGRFGGKFVEFLLLSPCGFSPANSQNRHTSRL